MTYNRLNHKGYNLSVEVPLRYTALYAVCFTVYYYFVVGSNAHLSFHLRLYKIITLQNINESRIKLYDTASCCKKQYHSSSIIFGMWNYIAPC